MYTTQQTIKMEVAMLRVSDIVAINKFRQSLRRAALENHAWVSHTQPVGFYSVRYTEKNGAALFTPFSEVVVYEQYFDPETNEPLFRPAVAY